MKTRLYAKHGLAKLALALLAVLPFAALAQTPVDDEGKVIGDYESTRASVTDLEELVGPIALYPDDLLAIVLPASAYPLQIVSAARFLEDLERDPSLKPDPAWDDSVVALLNYPEVIELLNDDIDWTWRLGEAVVSQQGDVVAAIEAFRDRAYAAGNLKSDDYQNVSRDEGVIEITPVAEDVIYVPYYEPERVVIYQPRPVYYYYPRRYPVYYYPYSSAYHFDHGYFWGVTTAFTIGWISDSLHVYHHSYRGHPYFGHTYWDRWWYRRPSLNIYNTAYVRNSKVTINHYYNGDRWRPRHDRRHYDRKQRVTHNRYYDGQRSAPVSRTQSVRRDEPVAFRDRGDRNLRRSNTNPERRDRRSATTPQSRRDVATRQREQRQASVRQTRQEPITFRERSARNTTRNDTSSPARHSQRDATRQQRSEPVARQRQQTRAPARQARQEPITFRDRNARNTTRSSTNSPERRGQRDTTRQQRVEPVARQRPQQRASSPQARLEHREPVTRSAPRQRAPQRSAPQRSAPQRSAPQRSAPQQKSESRRSESSGRSESRKERRTRR